MSIQICFIIFLIVGLLFIAGTLFTQITSFNRTGAKKFKFYTYLPFELTTYNGNIIQKTMTIIVKNFGEISLSIAMLMFALYAQQNGGDMMAAYILFAVYTLSMFSFCILKELKLSRYTAHMFATTFYVACTILLLSLYIFFFTNDRYNFGNGIINKGVQIANFVCTIVLLIFEFVLMLNKYYKNWFKMVKVDAETYNRPKYCYLAIVEWGTYLNLILSFLPVATILFCKI